MFGLDAMETLFVVTAFTFQIVLIIHFALRRWAFQTAMRFGPLVYALGIPAGLVSLILILNGADWYFWVSGILYLVWGLFGYVIEYRLKVEWRNPIRWEYFGPYVFLYLATIMFYWFPLAQISKPLWYVYAILFIVSTVLNVTSHKVPEGLSHQAV